jgi:D-glycero-D-manno-heptose 1,7-bisphosphate phosphatase
MINYRTTDKTWTLFLDRDGVINGERKDEYVLRLEDFIFLDGSLQALKILNEVFGVIVIITNQRGVSRGLMTLNDLHHIHQHMLQQIQRSGGRIDKIYCCTDSGDDSPNRKPQPGMAFQAKEDYPQIDLHKSFMVGNKLTDMQFGRTIGSKTIFVATTNPETPFPHPLIDARFNTLLNFATQFVH